MADFRFDPRRMKGMLRRFDFKVFLIFLLGFATFSMMVAIVKGWSPSIFGGLPDQGNFFAEIFSLIVEGTLFAVVLGYLVPERLRLAQQKADDEKWDPTRRAINGMIAEAILSEVSALRLLGPFEKERTASDEFVLAVWNLSWDQRGDDWLPPIFVTPDLAAKLGVTQYNTRGVEKLRDLPAKYSGVLTGSQASLCIQAAEILERLREIRVIGPKRLVSDGFLFKQDDFIQFVNADGFDLAVIQVGKMARVLNRARKADFEDYLAAKKRGIRYKYDEARYQSYALLDSVMVFAKEYEKLSELILKLDTPLYFDHQFFGKWRVSLDLKLREKVSDEGGTKTSNPVPPLLDAWRSIAIVEAAGFGRDVDKLSSLPYTAYRKPVHSFVTD